MVPGLNTPKLVAVGAAALAIGLVMGGIAGYALKARDCNQDKALVKAETKTEKAQSDGRTNTANAQRVGKRAVAQETVGKTVQEIKDDVPEPPQINSAAEAVPLVCRLELRRELRFDELIRQANAALGVHEASAGSAGANAQVKGRVGEVGRADGGAVRGSREQPAMPRPLGEGGK